MAPKQPRPRRLNKAMTPISTRPPAGQKSRTARKKEESRKHLYTPKNMRALGRGDKRNIKPDFSPFLREIVYLDEGYAYFTYQQRPTLLMDAMARQGYEVCWLNPERAEPKGMEKKEENIIFFTEKDKDIALKKSHVVKWTMHPMNANWANNQGNNLMVFDYVDDFPEFDDNARRKVEEAEVIFCTADVLMEKIASWGRQAILLPNGVEYNLYEEETRDPEGKYNGIPRPRIGYMGALTSRWFDFPLIEKMARSHPNWSIVLIGFLYGMHRLPLPKLPNIYYLGNVKYHDIPLYLSGLDVGTIPFLKGRIADACDPCKMYQYWAAGLPVVATEMREVKKFSPPYAWSVRSNVFIDAVEEALQKTAEDDSLSRKSLASQNTWDDRAKVALKTMDDAFLKRGVPSSTDKAPKKFFPKREKTPPKIMFLNHSPLITHGVHPALTKLGYETKILSLCFFNARSDDWNLDSIINKIKEWDPDFFFCDAAYFDQAMWGNVLDYITNSRAKFISWMTEDPFSTQEFAKFKIFTNGAFRSDLILTCASECLEHYRGRAKGESEVFMFACPEFPPYTPAKEKEGTILIANSYPHWPERKYQEQIISDIAKAKSLDIDIYGHGWAYGKGAEPVAYSYLPVLFDQHKIVLGIHSAASSPSQTSMRTYEVMGLNNLYLTYDTPAHRNLFREGKEYASWSNKEELIEKANFYLGHPEERERVAKAGAEAIAARHTYYHRWRVVEPYIKEWYGNFRKERVNEA